jgi:hypothetical protein
VVTGAALDLEVVHDAPPRQDVEPVAAEESITSWWSTLLRMFSKNPIVSEGHTELPLRDFDELISKRGGEAIESTAKTAHIDKGEESPKGTRYRI